MGRRGDLREGERRQSRVRGASLILAMAAMMAGGGISCVLVFGLPAPVQARADILSDRNVMDGSLHMVDGVVLEEEQYRVVVNQLPTTKEGSQECDLEFENPLKNRYGSRMNPCLKSTGGRIGGTRLMPPGKYVEMITLNQAPESREHPVLVELELPDERKSAGEMTPELTVKVAPE